MKTTRKEFLSGLASATAASALPSFAAKPGKGMLWIMYMQLGSHMWKQSNPLDPKGHFCGNRTWVDDAAWDARMAHAKAKGMNMILVDLAESIRYPSHPELAIEGANAAQSSRSAEWMNERVRKCKAMGLEVVPSLNLSATHDSWLGFYSRMLSTPTYYRVVGDLFRDVYDIFEKPRFMHMGMDEEAVDFAPTHQVAIFRQKDVLWHDINLFGKIIAKLGARPWMAADIEWWYPQDYAKNVSKDIVQQNWYYGQSFDAKAYKAKKDLRAKYIESYNRLDAAGFDQTPGPSNWLEGRDKKEGKTETRVNTDLTLEYCKRELNPDRVLGYVSLPWVGPGSGGNAGWFDACDQLAAARDKHYPES